VNIERIQELLRNEGLVGWLLADFQGINSIACRVARLEGMITRRWFCLIPAEGPISWIYSRVEPGLFTDRPGHRFPYAGYEDLDRVLTQVLPGEGRLAMEYSPRGALPTASRVDAGTFERIRTLCPSLDIVSSCELLQSYVALWTPEGLASHHRAVDHLIRLKDEALAAVEQSLQTGTYLSECSIQNLLVEGFQKADLITNHPPIVAVDEHAGNPHYAPHPDQDRRIEPNRVLLIDLWAKENGPESVYADITWMAYTGSTVPAPVQKAWEAVRDGRDAALRLAQERFARNQRVEGWELDRITRDLITSRGYGENFVHRTGHSLGLEDHADGANLDDYESRDTRPLIPDTGFTIEPGVYLPEFGIRSEIDVFIGPHGPEATTPCQESIDTIPPH
jgi:Xaa-Pro aminopeptidase